MAVALQTQAKSRLLGEIEICQECRNYATIGKKIPHKKTCSMRPSKPQWHTWESAEEYVRWEKANAQIAKENAMPIRKLQEVLYKESLKGFKAPTYLTTKIYNDGIAVDLHRYGIRASQHQGARNVCGQTIYAGMTLQYYWHDVLGVARKTTSDTMPIPQAHAWEDPKESQRWQRVTKQNEQEAKMPFKKLCNKLHQESLKGGSAYNISFDHGNESVKIYYGNPLCLRLIYEGATLANYWTETLRQNTHEVRHV